MSDIKESFLNKVDELREAMSPEHQAKMQQARKSAEAKRKPSKEFFANKEKEYLGQGIKQPQARRSAGIDTHKQFSKE